MADYSTTKIIIVIGTAAEDITCFIKDVIRVVYKTL